MTYDNSNITQIVFEKNIKIGILVAHSKDEPINIRITEQFETIGYLEESNNDKFNAFLIYERKFINNQIKNVYPDYSYKEISKPFDPKINGGFSKDKFSDMINDPITCIKTKLINYNINPINLIYLIRYK